MPFDHGKPPSIENGFVKPYELYATMSRCLLTIRHAEWIAKQRFTDEKPFLSNICLIDAFP
jgi:hypothetical protein